jgi:raffinose/stachyose/melibiose transport system permease protein
MKEDMKRRSWFKGHTLMALPAFLLFAAFFIYPMIRGIGFSFTQWDGIGAPRFVGLANFVSFFGDLRARKDIFTTLLFALGSAPLLNVFGLLYALILDARFRGKGAIRAIVYLPAVISPLIMGYIWYFLIQPERGFIATAFSSLLGASHAGALNWFTSRPAALAVLVGVNVWQYVGMTMVIYLAGLQNIPPSLYEACAMDGARLGATLHSVTLPLLAPSVRVNVITNVIGSLSVFDIVVSLTGGGPGYATESLSLYIMRMVFGGQTGYSTAVAIVLFLIILAPVLLLLRYFNRREVTM